MTTSKYARISRLGPAFFCATAAVALGVALAMAPTLALAEAHVRGKPDAVSVEAKNASVEEILVALSNAFDVRFRSSANLEKRLTGTYEGSLQQVVARVLSGYDFFVRSGETGIEITLLGSGKAVAVIGASSAEQRAADPALKGSEQPSNTPIPMKHVEALRPMPSTSGSAPSPVPGPGMGAAPSPAPGSMHPVPERGPSAVLPPAMAGTTPPAQPSPR
jgi:hypothetical protein